MSWTQILEIGRRTIAGESASSIAADLGFDASSVSIHATRTRERFIGPTLPCSCGRPAGHKGICSRTNYKHPPLSAETEATLIRKLIAGASAREIRADLGVGETRMRRYLASLTADQLSRRGAALRTRIETARIDSVHLAARGDELFARILRAMPRDMDPTLRDDACSELYLAVLLGDVPAEKAEDLAAQFRAAAYREWAASWSRMRSIDAPLSAEDGRTLGELIAADEAADDDGENEWLEAVLLP